MDESRRAPAHDGAPSWRCSATGGGARSSAGPRRKTGPISGCSLAWRKRRPRTPKIVGSNPTALTTSARSWKVNRQSVEPVSKTARATAAWGSCPPPSANTKRGEEAESRRDVSPAATRCVPIVAWCSSHPASTIGVRFLSSRLLLSWSEQRQAHRESPLTPARAPARGPPYFASRTERWPSAAGSHRQSRLDPERHRHRRTRSYASAKADALMEDSGGGGRDILDGSLRCPLR